MDKHDLAILDSRLHWRKSSTVTHSRQGEIVRAITNEAVGAIAFEGISIIYADRTQAGNVRRITGVDSGLTVSKLVPEGKIDIVNGVIRYVVNGAQDFTSPRNIYEIKEGVPPTEVPSSVTVSAPVSVFLYPYDAEVTWTNTNTVDDIQVTWSRNGSFVESNVVSAGGTSNATSDTYFAQGDDIFVTVAYFNEFGNGTSGSDSMIA